MLFRPCKLSFYTYLGLVFNAYIMSFTLGLNIGGIGKKSILKILICRTKCELNILIHYKCFKGYQKSKNILESLNCPLFLMLYPVYY